MKHILIAFKSRNSIYSFSNFLKTVNIKSDIINTPRSISSSCGLSLKISLYHYQNVINIIKNKSNLNIIGLFIFERVGFQEKLEKIF